MRGRDMARGRKPAPTSEKERKGVRKDRINTSEPKPPPGGVHPPEWLDPEAVKVWDSLAADLVAMGVLTPPDAHHFGLYCSTLGRIAKAEKALASQQYTTQTERGTRVNPLVRIIDNASSLADRLAPQWGIGASNRSRINLGPANVADELDEFLNS